MGLVDMFLTPAVAQRVGQIVKAGETRRRVALRKVLSDVAQAASSGLPQDKVVDAKVAEALVAGSQTQTLREVAQGVGNAIASEIIMRIATALDSK